jgi:hypothetical protein
MVNYGVLRDGQTHCAHCEIRFVWGTTTKRRKLDGTNHSIDPSLCNRYNPDGGRTLLSNKCHQVLLRMSGVAADVRWTPRAPAPHHPSTAPVTRSRLPLQTLDVNTATRARSLNFLSPLKPTNMKEKGPMDGLAPPQDPDATMYFNVGH